MEQNKSNKSVWLVAAIVVIVILIIVGYAAKRSGTSTDSQTVKIGYLGPFTGPVAGDIGADIANGIKLAALDRPEAGGKKIEVIYEDDGCDPKKATTAATKLVAIDKVKILVSVCSGATLAAAPIAEQNKVILFTPVSTSPKITDAGDYVFRSSASSIRTAEAVSALINGFGYKKAAILFETADYTVGWKDAFIKKFSENPANTIAAAEGVTTNSADLKTQLLKLSQAKPDVLLLVLNSSILTTTAITQLRDLKINLPVIGNEFMSVQSVVSNPLAEGMYATIYKYDSASPALASLLQKYTDTYHSSPSIAIYPALSYDGYNVILNAIDACKSDNPECLKAELYKTSNYQGISGTITIDEKGDTNREFTLKQIKGGKLTDIK